MKKVKGKKIKLLIIFILILIVLYIILNLNKEDETVNIEGIATINNPVISPSGKYQLRLVKVNHGVEEVKFDIYKISNGEIGSTAIYSCNESFRTRDTYFFLWGDDDTVWVYSGDLGVFFWTRISDNNWEEHGYTHSNVTAPELLKRLRPRYFNNFSQY